MPAHVPSDPAPPRRSLPSRLARLPADLVGWAVAGLYALLAYAGFFDEAPPGGEP